MCTVFFREAGSGGVERAPSVSGRQGQGGRTCAVCFRQAWQFMAKVVVEPGWDKAGRGWSKSICKHACSTVILTFYTQPHARTHTHTHTHTYMQLEMALGKPAAAEPLLRRALDISIKSNGPEATDTAVLLNSLASLLLDLGRCAFYCPCISDPSHDHKRVHTRV
jgi:hypothetical protein